MSEIIKVYNTKANAIANGSTGRISPLNPASQGAIANIGGMISNIGYGVGTIPYYIYNKYYYRIEANEPVLEFHIDWDEGEDNSSEKASIEIIKLKTPSTSVVTEHIFTEHKHFFPLIRVKSVGGYLSKWYTSDEATNDYTALEETTLSAGQNEFSVVSEEKAESDRISTFLPSNLPPIGILKADKKSIYSGIDNDTIANSYVEEGIDDYPLFYTYSTSTSSTKPDVVFTLQDNLGAVRKHTLAGTSIVSTVSGWDSVGASSDTAVKAIPLGNYTPVGQQSVHKITIKDGATDANVSWADTAGNDKYIDIHYESGVADKNGNYHTRIWFISAASDAEGQPLGSTLPDGYSGLKCGLSGSPGSHASIAEELRICLNANSVGGLLISMIVGNVGTDGTDSYFSCTLNGEGYATPWSESADLNSPNRVDCAVTTPGTLDGATITLTNSVSKLLRVELDNAKELSDTDRVYVKVWDTGNQLKFTPHITNNGTVAVLSNGSPIVELGADTIVYLDGTESRTRASNINISTYNFDDDKLLNGGIVQDYSTPTTQVSDIMSGTFSTTGSKELSYSFSNIGDSVDSDGRFYSTYRLPRLQVKDSMTDSTTANASDSLSYSAIEHLNDTAYTGTTVFQPSDFESRGLLLFSNKDATPAVGIGIWTDVSGRNRVDTYDVLGAASTYQLRDSTNLTDHPRNHLFIAKTDKFDRIFFRMNNTNAVAEANWPPSVAISAYYANGTTWTPLEIIDETQGLQTSGSIKFTMPHDWYKGDYQDIDSGTWLGPVDSQQDASVGDSISPADLWTFDAYGILICFTAKGTGNNETKLRCMNVWPYNNSHSQLIKIEDSHYVSLSSIAVAQSISFGRSSKITSIEDKFGKAEIRKIGASGGALTFGGIDLGETEDHRKTMVSYQKNATPVFLDISHKSGEITRFFGVVTRLSEDHPAGLMYPKWAVTMQISHILELSSTGAINSDKISIGGALVDDGKYLL